MENFEDVIDEVVDNEVRLKSIYKFSKSEEFNKLSEEEKVLIQKQAKVMDELTSVLKARVKYRAKMEA